MHDVVIVGAGIAGCTAAIYAARNRMDFVLVSKKFGGQFFESGEVLNYPGIIRTDGYEFSDQIEKQLEFNQVKPVLGQEVTAVESIKDGFFIKTDKSTYETKTVIIATGSHPKKLNVSGEDKFAKKGVTYCAICDGPLFKDKDIAVIGGGNSALEGVDFTYKIAKKVYLLNISKEFQAHRYLIDKITSYRNVEIIPEAETKQITGNSFVEKLIFQKDGQLRSLSVNGVIVEIGRIPATGFLQGFLKLTASKHVEISCQSKTSVEGVFAAGDCASGDEYQYVIAAGQGCIALLKAARFIAENR